MNHRIPAVARRDKSESNPILTWPMLALGLDCAYAKVSKFETFGGGLVGFDGQKLVSFRYRLLSLDGKEALVGEIFKQSEGEEAKLAFDDGFGGFSINSVVGELHVIASLTGEKYSDIMGKPPAMIVLPKSIPRKN